MNRIEFRMKSYVFDFDLRPPITVIHGNAPSGKSLFWQWLAVQKQLPENKRKYADVVLLNYLSDVRDIINKKDKLFVIDNTDFY